MKLNPSQIDRLFTFTRQHYVEYYDLQTELVDHLAHAIEAEWEQNPQFSFEEVLNNEFKKFGVEIQLDQENDLMIISPLREEYFKNGLSS